MNDDTRDAVILALALAVGMAFIQAWGLMLAVGIIHLDVFPEVQPVGYPVALGLMATVNLAFRSKVEASRKSD